MSSGILQKCLSFYLFGCLLLISKSKSAIVVPIYSAEVSEIAKLIDDTNLKSEIMHEALRSEPIDKNINLITAFSPVTDNNNFLYISPEAVNTSDTSTVYFWYYDKISTVVMGILCGAALDIEKATEIVKKPSALYIVALCKFIITPLVIEINLRQIFQSIY